MADVEWGSIEDAPAKEKFGGTIRVRTLWEGSDSAKAQFVEIDPGARWEGIDLHEPGPEEVYVVAGIFNDGVRDYAAGTFIHNPSRFVACAPIRNRLYTLCFYPEG
jgi:hypothetical protein